MILVGGFCFIPNNQNQSNKGTDLLFQLFQGKLRQTLSFPWVVEVSFSDEAARIEWDWAASAYFKLLPNLPSSTAPGSPLAPVWSRFLWSNEYLLFELFFPRCSFHLAKFNLVLSFPVPHF